MLVHWHWSRHHRCSGFSPVFIIGLLLCPRRLPGTKDQGRVAALGVASSVVQPDLRIEGCPEKSSKKTNPLWYNAAWTSSGTPTSDRRYLKSESAAFIAASIWSSASTNIGMAAVVTLRRWLFLRLTALCPLPRPALLAVWPMWQNPKCKHVTLNGPPGYARPASLAIWPMWQHPKFISPQNQDQLRLIQHWWWKFHCHVDIHIIIC